MTASNMIIKQRLCAGVMETGEAIFELLGAYLIHVGRDVLQKLSFGVAFAFLYA